MLLDQNKFVVKSKGKLLSSKKTFEILDPESGSVLGSAKDTTGIVGGMLGGTTIEVKDADSNKVLFTVGRSGLLMKKDQVKDAKGEVVGRYKSKTFSLAGGFHVYDKGGKHLAEIQGKMLKKEYKFLTPEKAEIGTVSKSSGGLGGMAKSLLSGGETYVVQIDPEYNSPAIKMLILGATIAAVTIFNKSKGGAVVGGGDDGDDD
jgi:uncharacterized protein YxjI